MQIKLPSSDIQKYHLPFHGLDIHLSTQNIDDLVVYSANLKPIANSSSMFACSVSMGCVAQLIPSAAYGDSYPWADLSPEDQDWIEIWKILYNQNPDYFDFDQLDSKPKQVDFSKSSYYYHRDQMDWTEFKTPIDFVLPLLIQILGNGDIDVSVRKIDQFDIPAKWVSVGDSGERTTGKFKLCLDGRISNIIADGQITSCIVNAQNLPLSLLAKFDDIERISQAPDFDDGGGIPISKNMDKFIKINHVTAI